MIFQGWTITFAFFTLLVLSFAEETFLEVLKKTEEEEKNHRKLCLVFFVANLEARLILNQALFFFIFKPRL